MSSVLELLDYRRQVFDLYADVRGQLRDDPQAAHGHWRDGRDRLFAGHPQTALAPDARAGFSGLPYYPYDPAFAVTAPLDSDVEHERFPIGTSGGSQIAFERVGRVALPWGTLDVYWLDAYGGGLFLPFRDATAGDTTYGGGRYLLDTVKGADLGSAPSGELVLDFNFAYHPSCFYDAGWSCPLAPPDNRIEVRIEAGERT